MYGGWAGLRYEVGISVLLLFSPTALSFVSSFATKLMHLFFDGSLFSQVVLSETELLFQDFFYFSSHCFLAFW